MTVWLGPDGPAAVGDPDHPVMQGRTYHRYTVCLCGAQATVWWHVDPAGGVEVVECEAGCHLNVGTPF